MRAEFRLALLAGLLVMFGDLSPLSAKEDLTLESRIKAAYILKFIPFMEWNADTPLPVDGVTIGVIGSTGIFSALEEFKNANAKVKINLVSLSSEDDLTRVHILFVDKALANHLPKLVAKLKDRPVLTIGESDNFVSKGGIIMFVKEAGKVKFEINVNAAKRAGLKISARVLKAARRVHN
ncbi:MAG: YfiR family protein [Candidatus Nitrohelix vancouverensis]|uniref:YfiR family protein n=1 Tax=Candidatus Nitrohelix vancouverensis TaxID=2705534 RepID=A0A7T0C1A3_9BACT|nr:MAG: YfiR family protein [Candidatus Nitrohelix vancouverensis]